MLTAKWLRTWLIWFANVLVEPPANNSPTGLRPLLVTMSEPESPPALKLPSLMPTWPTKRATPSDAQENMPRGL
jgi:hypothetical protein